MPIGVVIYISSSSDKCGYAMTASSIATETKWSIEYAYTGAFQSYDWQDAITDFDVSGNMTKIIQYAQNRHGDKAADYYPAVYAALNYAPSSAPTSKGKWALPTAGILNSLYTNLNAVNNAISKIGGTRLTYDSHMGVGEHIWSSTEFDIGAVWVFSMFSGTSHDGVGTLSKDNGISDHSVRPVIAF